ncbi:MAG: hypothetical protein QOG10_4705 [Kribbellaceae bacterium]|jgi:hypothetical protein|nr:hypothetical protein [Kribbellaceae bacterium]
MATEAEQVDSASPTYQEFARLYRIARSMRPSDIDRWNGELHAHTDDVWGSVNPTTGTITLNHEQVLRYLTGSPSHTDRAEQAQALQTVLHETYHQRVAINAPSEPNAFRGYESKALDEGLTEYQASQDVMAFGVRAGYGMFATDSHAYPGAYTATTQLLDYAVGPAMGRNDLAQRALDQPVVMRWDTIADEIIRNRLTNVVPPDLGHQQAARAVLVKAMAHPTWDGLHQRDEIAGRIAAHHAKTALDSAIERLHQHYRTDPSQPSPTTPPQPAADVGHDQIRTAENAQRTDPALRAAMTGQAPASHATNLLPSLGDRARRRAHSPNQTGRSTTIPAGRNNR